MIYLNIEPTIFYEYHEYNVVLFLAESGEVLTMSFLVGLPDLEWKLIYVGSAEDENYYQQLESVLVGPMNVGTYRFVLEVNRLLINDFVICIMNSAIKMMFHNCAEIRLFILQLGSCFAPTLEHQFSCSG